MPPKPCVKLKSGGSVTAIESATMSDVIVCVSLPKFCQQTSCVGVIWRLAGLNVLSSLASIAIAPVLAQVFPLPDLAQAATSPVASASASGGTRFNTPPAPARRPLGAATATDSALRN